MIILNLDDWDAWNWCDYNNPAHVYWIVTKSGLSLIHTKAGVGLKEPAGISIFRQPTKKYFFRKKVRFYVSSDQVMHIKVENRSGDEKCKQTADV